MILITGLGNPGKKYARTRHNAGFLTIDLLREKLGFESFKEDKKFKAEICAGEYEGNQLTLLKPQIFMNKSGEAVQEIMSFYKIPLSHLWVIYDDIDLPFRTLRIRKNGSAGTHNGMRSIIEKLGSNNFPRFRIGIGEGSAGFGKSDLSDWILSKVPVKDWMILKKTVEKAAEAVIYALKQDISSAMNRYN